MTPTLTTFAIVCPLVLLAGFVDAIGGGGGLISLPAYLIAGLPPHQAIATNKLSSTCGTGVTAVRFARQGLIPWRMAIPCVAAALLGAFCGARLSLLVDSAVLSKVLYVVLPVTAVLVLRKNTLREEAPPPENVKKTTAVAAAISLAVGVYDGFYGPGTGTFLIILFSMLAKLDIRSANGLCKAVNLTTNVTSLLVFLRGGQVLITLGLAAAACNMLGNWLGSGMAIKSFKDLDTCSRGLQTELNKINKQLKFNPDSTSLLAMKQEVLAEKVEVTRETLKKLKDMQGEVERAAKNGTLGEDKYREYKLEVEKTENVLKNLEKQLSETGDKFSEVQRKSGAVTFKNAEDKVEHFKGKVKDMTDAALDNAEKLSKGFDKVGDGLEKVGGVVNKGSAAAAAVLAGSVAAFKDLDEGYDVIVKKTGAVDSKFDGLKQTADELFGNSVFDMTDIGNAIGEVNTRFGYTDEVLKSVTEQYLQFAKINDADVSDSVAKTARIMQAWDSVRTTYLAAWGTRHVPKQ